MNSLGFFVSAASTLIQYNPYPFYETKTFLVSSIWKTSPVLGQVITPSFLAAISWSDWEERRKWLELWLAVGRGVNVPRSYRLVHLVAIRVDYLHSWFCHWFCIQRWNWRGDSMVMSQPIYPTYQHHIRDNEHCDFHGCSTGASLMLKDQLVEWWTTEDGT